MFSILTALLPHLPCEIIHLNAWFVSHLVIIFLSIIICIARNLPDLPKTTNTAPLWMNAVLLGEVQLEVTSVWLEDLAVLCKTYCISQFYLMQLSFKLKQPSMCSVHSVLYINGTVDDWNCAVCLIKKSNLSDFLCRHDSVFVSEEWWRKYFLHEFTLRQDVWIILVTGSWFLKRAGAFD